MPAPLGLLDRRHFAAWLAGSGLTALPRLAAASPASLRAWTLEGLQGPVLWEPHTGSKSKPWLYLDFWASWCGPCRLSFPWMNSLHDQWSGKGLRIVAVTVDRKREEATGFLKANPARFEVAFDPDAALARQLRVQTMPTSLLVAPDGIIVHRHEGFTASLGEKAAATVREALQRSG